MVIELTETVSPPKRPVCGRCEVWPTPPSGPGRLHVRLPLGHSFSKFARTLAQKGVEHEVRPEGIVTIFARDTDLSDLGALVSASLTPREAGDARAMFQRDGDSFDLNTLLEVESLGHFAGRAQIQWLLDLIEADRLTSYFHPILHAQSGEVFAQECLARGLDEAGNLVSPARLFGVARDADCLFQLDLATRRAAIRQAAIHGTRSKIFVNFTPTAIYDPQFCLRSTIALIKEVGLRPEQVVFEVVESEQVADVAHLNGILDVYRASGFEVALDDIGAGYSSLTMLSKLRPDYVKIDRELISDVDSDRYKAVITSKLIETAHDLELRVIAEGIETPGELGWLQANDVDFVQGFLFAKPSAQPTTGVWPW